MALKKWTQEQMLDVLRRIVDDVGRGVTLREFLDQSGVPESQIRRTFGTWDMLRAQAGLSPADRDQRRVSDEQLWKEFSRLFKLLRRTPTARELDRLGRFSASTYYMRFGRRKQLRQAFRDGLAELQSTAEQAGAGSADVAPREGE